MSLHLLDAVFTLIGIKPTTLPGEPELPRAYVDTTYDAAYEHLPDLTASSPSELDQAFAMMVPGDVVELDAGSQLEERV